MAEVVNASLAAVEEPSTSSLQMTAASADAGPSLSPAEIFPSLSALMVTPSQVITVSESMELDSYKGTSAPTTARSDVTKPVALALQAWL
ncbi:hypothetical protein C0989_004305 [Termitomyces sp. Mn162]|nr:hypothetical protein C0989_004305 [Termitomyces sp. Mn162]